jgi:hypothetical protein
VSGAEGSAGAAGSSRRRGGAAREVDATDRGVERGLHPLDDLDALLEPWQAGRPVTSKEIRDVPVDVEP